jgi:SnoaL-like domain
VVCETCTAGGAGVRRATEDEMAISKEPMTDEQRKSVALEYLKAFDNGGTTSTGGSILDLFADDAQVHFPKWGLATGKDAIGRMFGDVGATLERIVHDYANFNWIMTGTDTFACEGTSFGEHQDGEWRAGVTHAGRWCDVFEVRDFLIQRCFIYLDPDYAGIDTDRYPWLAREGRDPSVPLNVGLREAASAGVDK